MIKVVFLDVDDTLLSFSEYVKQAMRDGFKKYGLKPYTDSWTSLRLWKKLILSNRR